MTSNGFSGVPSVHDEPIVGWRAWRVISAEGAKALLRGSDRRVSNRLKVLADFDFPEVCLVSCSSVIYVWVPAGTNVAEHLWASHACSGLVASHCNCGFWAYKKPESLRASQFFPGLFRGRYNGVGRVSLWGKVVVGSMGYRAEKAYPLDIWLPADLYEMYATKIRDIYKIDVFCGLPDMSDPDFEEVVA